MIRTPEENSRANPPSETPQTQSKRSRLLGLARTTRDVYIPKITGSVTQLASDVSSKAFTTTEAYDVDGNLKIPQDASIYLFPSTSHENDDGTYAIAVGGWLSCPGLMTRKNRMILSLVKHIIRYDSNSAKEKLESSALNQNVINENSSDSESVYSDAVSLSADPVTSTQSLSREPSAINEVREDLLKERLNTFIARYVANAQLSIIIGSEDSMQTDQLSETTTLSDSNGFFLQDITVNYKPSVIQVTATGNETICAFQAVEITPSDGVGIISDIDDTIKLTGILGNKRQLLSNLFLGDVNAWAVPSVIKWYNDMFKKYKLTFHYVSNSPWQLLPLVVQYVKAVKLPWGSFQLKQYTGNLLKSIMEPSSSRKQTALHAVLTKYPHKAFICVGDSGEYDFDSYVNLAKKFPDQILGIFIRYVPGSLSDVDDLKILHELNRMLKNRHKPAAKESEVADLIDLSSSPPPIANDARARESKLPPMVPKKPTALKGNSIEKPPALPKRTTVVKSHTDTDIITYHAAPSTASSQRASSLRIPLARKAPPNFNPTTQPQLPRRRPTSPIGMGANDLMNNLQDIYHSHLFEELTNIDPRGAEWIQRVESALIDLANCAADVCFFTDKDEDLYERSNTLIKQKLHS